MEKQIEDNVEIAKKTAKNKYARFIPATFETVEKIRNVLVALPDVFDEYLKEIPRSKIVTLDHPSYVIVAGDCYQRGIMVENKLVTVDYYGFLLKDFEDKEVMANVSVVKRNNYKKDGEETLIIKIKKNEKPKKEALFKLEVGASIGKFAIPGTKKFINFRSLKKGNKIIEIKRD
jgi:hypothetical protein